MCLPKELMCVQEIRNLFKLHQCSAFDGVPVRHRLPWCGGDIGVQREVEIRSKMVSDQILKGIRTFPHFWTGAEMSVI